MSDIDIFLHCDDNKQVLEALCIKIVEELILMCPFPVFEKCEMQNSRASEDGIIIYSLSETHVY